MRLGTRLERIDRNGEGWILRTSTGDLPTGQVIVAAGYEHTGFVPDWPGRDRFEKPLIHSGEYCNPQPFRDADALVVGPGCSGMEIGDLTEYGLPVPEEGVFSRLRRLSVAPAIVDKEVIQAIRDRRIEIVAGVESLDETGVTLADGSRIEPDAVVAATGYRPGLEPLVGHLGVLNERGAPHAAQGQKAAPGLRFVGYRPLPAHIGHMGREARRAAKEIAASMRSPVPARAIRLRERAQPARS